MDPLSALRDFTVRGELDKIVKVGDEFRFGNDYIFSCGAETAYRSKQGNLYTLETLVYYVKNHHIKHTEYLQNARTQKIPAVTLPDRKPLLEYLQGKVASNDAIEFVVPQNPRAADPVPIDVEEYRPEDPGLIGIRSPADEVEDEKSRVRVPEKVDYVSMIKSCERPLKDRELLLECRHRDFYSVLVASTRREEERQRMESQQRKDGLVAKSRLMGADDRGLGFWKDGEDMGYDSTPKPKMHLKGSKIGEGVPIILVPSAFQTLITIYNVKEFLEDGVYIPTDVKVKQMKGAKPDCVTVQKKFSRDRVVTAYEVRDKPSSLKAEDWDRVVAVFVLGKEWQFKDWPFKDHVEIFNKIIGFFMRFEDDSVESAKMVKQWNVKIISISKNKRHQDRAAALEVWDRLEEFMRSRSHN
ncbi:protein CDC73 homolog [Macadamia integrifolia]|uniref:protein CDC73 homolog n=1 Tax=Macadamia integrifolia TaxID=60698 RepID=UPI001C4EB4AA|nr:protein CDC73 homolog [Macadamia integrifolia]XP_042517494.1 protein CDC73 homolog [Macadamia integrifolia]